MHNEFDQSPDGESLGKLEALCLELGGLTRESDPIVALTCFIEAAACRLEAAGGEADLGDTLASIQPLLEPVAGFSGALTKESFGFLDQPGLCGEYAHNCLHVLFVVLDRGLEGLGRGPGVRTLAGALALCEALVERMFGFGVPEAAEVLQNTLARVRRRIERRAHLEPRNLDGEVLFLDDEVLEDKVSYAVETAKRLLSPLKSGPISADAWTSFEEDIVRDANEGELES